MKARLLRTSLCIFSTALAVAATPAQAQPIKSTWVGQTDDHWSDPTKWNPMTVPDNTGAQKFNVTIGAGADYPGINVDQDVTLNSVHITGDFAAFTLTDHNLTSAASSIGINYPNEKYGGGVVLAIAMNKSVVADLGNLADFSGTSLNTGNYVADAGHAPPGVTATLRFNGADIRATDAYLGLNGPGALIQDEFGHDAVANLDHILVDNGVFDIESGRSFTTAGALLNEGEVRVISAFAGADASSTLTINGDYTSIGYPLDPGTLGATLLLAAGPVGDAKVVVDGQITNYEAATKTLHKSYYIFEAANGRSATTQVLGGSTPLDIVTSEASLILIGPNTGFLDNSGNDALRNLAVNARMQVGDRDFTTAGSFTSTSRLTILGDTRFTANGDLTITGGYLQLTGITGYAEQGEDSFPADPPYVTSTIHIKGDLNIPDGTELRYHIADAATVPQTTVDGAANLGGQLTIVFGGPGGGEPPHNDGHVTHADTLTILQASSLNGEFNNAPNGSRVIAIGDGIAGTFKVSYDNGSVQLSEFLPHASMLNLSTRVKVGTGMNTAIAGFIVRGREPRRVMIRGLGPSLASQGVTGVLADPLLRLHDSAGTLVVKNDDWTKASHSADISATGIAPTDPKESAIIAVLDPGSYTATLLGKNNGTGIGLIEVYDLDDPAGLSDLANLSTRGQVESGDDAMIGGTIVGSGAAAHMIVRALGPSLVDKGVSNVLADPTLEIRDASGTKIAGNDNWQSNATQAAKIQDAGLAPGNPRESAVAVTLKPGNYTAVVRGKNDTQGVALVEFYKLN